MVKSRLPDTNPKTNNAPPLTLPHLVDLLVQQRHIQVDHAPVELLHLVDQLLHLVHVVAASLQLLGDDLLAPHDLHLLFVYRVELLAHRAAEVHVKLLRQ
eukprot:64193-Chlamydomonas_euryale.AAC.1